MPFLLDPPDQARRDTQRHIAWTTPKGSVACTIRPSGALDGVKGWLTRSARTRPLRSVNDGTDEAKSAALGRRPSRAELPGYLGVVRPVLRPCPSRAAAAERRAVRLAGSEAVVSEAATAFRDRRPDVGVAAALLTSGPVATFLAAAAFLVGVFLLGAAGAVVAALAGAAFLVGAAFLTGTAVAGATGAGAAFLVGAFLVGAVFAGATCASLPAGSADAAFLVEDRLAGVGAATFSAAAF
jgi:hypothetical protein